VFPVTFDPVASGFVASLSRPGGNRTGLSPLNPTVTAKRVELLRELPPRVGLAAVLRNPTNPGATFVLRETETAARGVRLALQAFEERTAGDIDAAVAAAAVRGRAEALLVISDALFVSEQGRIVELSPRHRLPSMFDTPEFESAGGLMSYGTDLTDLFRRAATYVHKILRGGRPARGAGHEVRAGGEPAERPCARAHHPIVAATAGGPGHRVKGGGGPLRGRAL
jgi:putative ABC transport system substrate-binding protein